MRVQLERGVEARPDGDDGDLAVVGAQAREFAERLRHAEEVLADAGRVELGAEGADEAALCVFGGDSRAGKVGFLWLAIKVEMDASIWAGAVR